MSEARVLLDRQLTEKDWQAWVTDLAKLFEWRVYSTRAAMTGKGYRTPVTSKGFPDLLLLKGGRLLAVELKTGTAVRPEQAEWLAALAEVEGIETYVWRPADRSEVVEVLAGRKAA